MWRQFNKINEFLFIQGVYRGNFLIAASAYRILLTKQSIFPCNRVGSPHIYLLFPLNNQNNTGLHAAFFFSDENDHN